MKSNFRNYLTNMALAIELATLGAVIVFMIATTVDMPAAEIV